MAPDSRPALDGSLPSPRWVGPDAGCWPEWQPGWPAYGKASAEEAGGHRGWRERYEQIEAELRPLLVLAHAGHSDAEIVAAGYDHQKYGFYRAEV